MEKYHPMAIGVILDVKLYNLAPSKEALLTSVGNIPVGEDLFYMYCPEAITPLEKKGEKIQSIYYFGDIKINPEMALTQTTYVLGSERDEEYRRKVIFITDRYNKKYDEQISIIFKINEVQRFDCEYYFIGIGQQNFEFNDINIINLDSIEELQKTLDEIFSEDSYGKTLDGKSIDRRRSNPEGPSSQAKVQQEGDGISESENQPT